MAGDWIKMRGALLDHPKVIAIGKALHKNKDFREWLTPGGSGPSNGQIIGKAALRCVTTSLLMRVWSMAREHGKFNGDDLVLEHSQIEDLDEMAGAPGVGEAMASVKWAIENCGVTLPNFKEFNVPMSAAEKQREYRKRVTASLSSEGNGNRKNVTSREEERREEVITPPSPPVPKKLNGNGEHRARKKPATLAPDSFEITEPMWAWAQGKGVQHERIETETEKFLDHHKAKGSLFSDWPAAWRKWMRNVVDFAARH